MKRTQIEWVKSQLRSNGRVSRNECLAHHISRLGAIICVLKENGWEFTTYHKDGDYVYKLAQQPKRVEVIFREVNGIRTAIVANGIELL